MRVLSLFDGMSCGQIALKEIGITPEVYYASEIDKFAIKQTQLNFPNTIQVGDVRDLNVEDLGHIDLILAGSPCTDMSFSGKRKGLSTVEGIEIKSLNEYLELKKQGFEFAGQSYLFWEFIRILNDVRKTNPDVLFLLENVKMGKKWGPVFDDAIGFDILPRLKAMGFLDTNVWNPGISTAGITHTLQFGNALPKNVFRC